MSSDKDNAHKRAIEDYSQSSQHFRALTQYVFAANGGAAIAMLSFLTAIATAKTVSGAVSVAIVIRAFAFAAGFFLSGVLMVLLAILIMALAKQSWGHFWEENALTDSVDFRHPFARRGERFDRLGLAFLLLAVVLFVPGCCFAIGGFLQ